MADLSSDRTIVIRNPMLDGVPSSGGLTLGSHREGTVTKEAGTFTFVTATTIDHASGTVRIRRQVFDNSPDA